MNFWEPWETSTLLAAQRMAQSSILESSFWIPQVDNVFVAQPLLQLWFLSLSSHIFSEIDPFWIRLPGALAGIFIVCLSFFAVRQVSTRRAAWMTVIALLTMPMFVLSGKLIHGDIWLIVAVSTPQLFYLLASYATTRRMHRTMLVFTGLSCILSFLAGGLFALAILALSGALFLFVMRRHPQKQAFLKPLSCRYFIVSIFLAFVAIGCIFGTIVTQSRYAIERRTPMTLAEVNNALDNDNVISIERRNQQIIGTVKSSNATPDSPEQRPFILVESHSNLNTNANEIFAQSESDRKTFVNDLMWRFQKQTPIRAEKQIPDLEGSFENALRFFWYHTNSSYKKNVLPLVRATEPSKAFADANSAISANTYNDNAVLQSGIIPTPVFRTDKGTLLRVLNDDKISPWIEVQNGAYQRGYVMRSTVEPTASTQNIRWFSWIDILLYGLMPWACFFPIALACLFVSHKKLAISNAPFIGEFAQDKKEANDAHSALQKLLFCWIIADLIALFVGVNQCNRVFFAGIVPTAILFGIAISAQTFWRTVRNSLEARVFLIVFAWATLFFAMYSLNDEPYRIVRYLLTDPLMHWGQKFSLPSEFIVYAIIFACLTPLAFSGIAETIQNRLTALREQFKRPKHEVRTSSSSSSTLIRVSREETTPMPYAAAITLTLIAVISSTYIYHTYLPSVTENLTEEALIQRYFELANQSEPVYLLSGENDQLGVSYRDCDPGYVCESNRCRISTFSSYSLDVAKPISRQNMLQAIDPKSPAEAAFYIIPKDALFDINITYRHMFAQGARKNLPLIDAPSSRLYLIGETAESTSSNPMDSIFINELPKEATKMQIPLDDEITLEGFKIDKLDFESQKILTMTVFYRVTQKINAQNQLKFSFEIVNRKIGFEVPLLPNHYDVTELAPSDIVARKIDFSFPMMPRHDVLSVKIATAQSEALIPMTTIDF